MGLFAQINAATEKDASGNIVVQWNNGKGAGKQAGVPAVGDTQPKQTTDPYADQSQQTGVDPSRHRSAIQEYMDPNGQQEQQQEFNWITNPQTYWQQISVNRLAFSGKQIDRSTAEKNAAAIVAARNTVGSGTYNQYANGTMAGAVDYLRSHGYLGKGEQITTEWYAAHYSLLDKLEKSDATGGVKQPKKNASADEWAAYYIYKLTGGYNPIPDPNDPDATKAFEDANAPLSNSNRLDKELNQVRERIDYWVSRTDLNLSDDQIIEKLDIDKTFKTLSKIDSTASSAGGGLSLARGTDYTSEVLKGLIWAARNGDKTSSINDLMYNYYTGVGNRWVENKDTSDKLNPNSENFNPYAVGCTMDTAAMYFGVQSFNQKWLDDPDIKNDYYVNGSTYSRTLYEQVSKAEEFTAACEKEYDDLLKYVQSMVDKNLTVDDILVGLDAALAPKGKYSHLADLDKSLENKNGDLVSTTRALAYSKKDLTEAVRKAVAARDSKEAESTADLAMIKQYLGGMDPATPQKTTDNAWRDYVYSLETMYNAAVLNGDTELGALVLKVTGEHFEQDVDAVVQGMNGKKYTPQMANAVSILQMAYYASSHPDLLSALESCKRYNDAQTAREKAIKEIEKVTGTPYKELEPGQYFNMDLSTIFDGMSINDRAELLAKTYEGLSVEPDENGKLHLYDENKFDYTGYLANDKYDELMPLLTSRKLTGAGDERVQNIYNLYAEVSRQDELLKKYEGQYNQNKQTWDQWQKLNQSVQTTARAMGGDDASKATLTYQMIDMVMGIGMDYTPTQWTAYDWYTSYVDNKVDSVLARNKETGEEVEPDRNKYIAEAVNLAGRDKVNGINNIEFLQLAVDYLDSMQMNIPDEYRKNIERQLAAWQRAVDQADYFSLLGEKDFSDQAQSGKDLVAYAAKKNGLDPYHCANKAFVLDNDLGRQSMDYEAYMGLAMMIAGVVSDEEIAKLSQAVGVDSGVQYMTQEEKDIFMYLLQRDGGNMENAIKYYNSLVDSQYGVLPVRTQLQKQEEVRQDVQSSGWRAALHTIASFESSFLQPIGAAYAVASRIIGQEINPYNPAFGMSRYTTTVRSETVQTYLSGKEWYNKLLEYGYNGFTSAVDSFNNAAVFGPFVNGFGTLSQTAATGTGRFIASAVHGLVASIPMGTGAMGASIMEAKERGASDDQALALGVSTFFSETITEAITMNNLYDWFSGASIEGGAKGMREALVGRFKEMLKDMGEEFIGEGGNEIAENYFDRMIMGNLSNYNTNVEYLIQHYGLSRAQAERMAQDEFWQGVRDAAITGALSAFMSGSVGAASQTINDIRGGDTARFNQALGQINLQYEFGANTLNLIDSLSKRDVATEASGQPSRRGEKINRLFEQYNKNQQSLLENLQNAAQLSAANAGLDMNSALAKNILLDLRTSMKMLEDLRNSPTDSSTAQRLYEARQAVNKNADILRQFAKESGGLSDELATAAEGLIGEWLGKNEKPAPQQEQQEEQQQDPYIVEAEALHARMREGEITPEEHNQLMDELDEKYGKAKTLYGVTPNGVRAFSRTDLLYKFAEEKNIEMNRIDMMHEDGDISDSQYEALVKALDKKYDPDQAQHDAMTFGVTPDGERMNINELRGYLEDGLNKAKKELDAKLRASSKYVDPKVRKSAMRALEKEWSVEAAVERAEQQPASPVTREVEDTDVFVQPQNQAPEGTLPPAVQDIGERTAEPETTKGSGLKDELGNEIPNDAIGAVVVRNENDPGDPGHYEYFSDKADLEKAAEESGITVEAAEKILDRQLQFAMEQRSENTGWAARPAGTENSGENTATPGQTENAGENTVTPENSQNETDTAEKEGGAETDKTGKPAAGEQTENIPKGSGPYGLGKFNPNATGQVGAENLYRFRNAVPTMLADMNAMAKTDEQLATTALDFFEANRRAFVEALQNGAEISTLRDLQTSTRQSFNTFLNAVNAYNMTKMAANGAQSTFHAPFIYSSDLSKTGQAINDVENERERHIKLLQNNALLLGMDPSDVASMGTMTYIDAQAFFNEHLPANAGNLLPGADTTKNEATGGPGGTAINADGGKGGPGEESEAGKNVTDRRTTPHENLNARPKQYDQNGFDMNDPTINPAAQNRVPSDNGQNEGQNTRNPEESEDGKAPANPAPEGETGNEGENTRRTTEGEGEKTPANLAGGEEETGNESNVRTTEEAGGQKALSKEGSTGTEGVEAGETGKPVEKSTVPAPRPEGEQEQPGPGELQQDNRPTDTGDNEPPKNEQQNRLQDVVRQKQNLPPLPENAPQQFETVETPQTVNDIVNNPDEGLGGDEVGSQSWLTKLMLLVNGLFDSSARAQTAGVAAALTDPSGARGEIDGEMAQAAAAGLAGKLGAGNALQTVGTVMNASRNKSNAQLALQIAGLTNNTQSSNALNALGSNPTTAAVDAMIRAAYQDSKDPGFTAKLADGLNRYQVAREIAKANVPSELLDAVKKAKLDYDNAVRNENAARNDYQQTEQAYQGATEHLQSVSAQFTSDPGGHAGRRSSASLTELDAAVGDVNARRAVRGQYQQRYANARRATQTAYAALQNASSAAYSSMQTAAQNNILQSNAAKLQQRLDQRMAQTQAMADKIAQRQKAEQAAKEAEYQARQKADEDRQTRNSGKLDADAFIDRYLPNAPEEVKAEARKRINKAFKEATDVQKIASRKRFNQQLGRKFDVNIQIEDTSKGGTTLRVNGYYNAHTNTITLDRAATQSDAIYAVALHELTHSMEISGLYDQYANAVLELKYGNDTARMESDIRARQMLYNNRLAMMKEADSTVDATPLTYDQARKELVANLGPEILYADKATVDKLVSEKPSLARRIWSSITRFIKKMAGMQDATLTKIERTRDLFEKALEDAKKIRERNGQAVEDRTQYALMEFEDGTRFVDVQIDQDLFDGLSLAETRKTARDYIKKYFKDSVIGIDNKAFVNGKSASEYMTTAGRNVTEEAKMAKMRASTEIDNLMDAGTNPYHLPDGMDGHQHDNYPGGFDYLYTIFKVGDQYYRGKINIGLTARGSKFHNLTEIQNITQDIHSSYGTNPKSKFLRDVSVDNIAQDRRNINGQNGKVSYSLPVGEANAALKQHGIEIDSESGAAVQYSIRTAPQTEAEIDEAVDRLVNSGLGFTEEESRAWVESLNTVSSIILQNMMALDYANDPRYSWIKKNSDYTQGSIDFNTNCPKRTQFTAIFDRLQQEFPDRVFTAQDYESIRQKLIEQGVTVTCGPCFVEDRRQHTGEIAQGFIDQLKDGSLKPKFQKMIGSDTYVPTQYDLVTYEGLRKLYDDHRGLHDAFVAFNNARGMASARLVEGMAEYNNQIKKWSKRTVTGKNNKGGLRIFSLSDADPRTMIDIIQIVLDSSEKGLMIQGYTKKAWFARMIKDTGMRVLRSHIPRGNGIQDGQIRYDDVEGINRFDKNYVDANGIDVAESSPNIGDNIIGINDDMIRVAMKTREIDQIIPFHSSLANMIRNKKKIGDWMNYKLDQTDKDASTGMVADKQVNIYKDVINAWAAKGTPITNKVEFVNAFLEVCKSRGLTPRFDKFLDKVDGEYVYTEGYEKFLVDYKLFDRDTGEIIPQVPVQAKFDDAFNRQVLEEYVRGVSEIVPAKEEDYQAVRDMFEGRDVSYSLPIDELDANYMDAVEAGDMDEAQRMVDQAAEQAGYDIGYLVYRGDSGPYNVLKTGQELDEENDAEFNDDHGNLGNGLYFTPDRGYAERFAGRNGILRKFYLKSNMANLDDADIRAIRAAIKSEIEDETGYFSRDELYDALMNETGTNGIRATGVGGFSAGAREAVVRESWQAKLADPVTYDDGGNVIPLSERFNSDSDDIRYSLPSDDVLDEMINSYLSGELGDYGEPLTSVRPSVQRSEVTPGAQRQQSHNSQTPPATTNRRERQNSPQRIVKNLASALGVGATVGTRHMNAEGARVAGYYVPHFESMAVHNDWAGSYIVGMHEIGHALESRTGLVGTPEMINRLFSPDFQHYEFDPMAYLDHPETLPHEAFAEFMWRYMEDEDLARKFAGDQFVTQFEDRLRQNNLYDTVHGAAEEVREWRASSVADRIGSTIHNRSEKEHGTIRDWFRKRTAEMVDATVAAERVNHEIRRQNGNRLIPIEQDLRQMSRLVNFAGRRANAILTQNLTDVNGTIIGDSLADRFKAAGFEGTEENIQLLERYMLAQHSLDRDAHGKPVFDDHITKEERENWIRQIQNTRQDVVDAEQAFQQYRREFLQAWMVDTGYMSKQMLDELNDTYPHYVPTFRVKDERYNASMNQLGARHYTMRQATGSSEDIWSPIDSWMNMVNSIVGMNLQNQAALAFERAYLGYEGMGIFAKDITQEIQQAAVRADDDNLVNAIWSAGTSVPNGIVIQHADGTQTAYEILDTELYKLLAAASETSNNPIWDKVAKLTQGMAALTTGSNPIFAVRNFMRDFQTSVNYGTWAKTYGDGLYKWAKAFWEVWQRKGSWEDYEALGGGGWTRIDTGTRKGMNEYRDSLFEGHEKENKLKYGAKKIWSAITFERLNEIVEQTSRYAEYRYGKHDLNTAQGRQEAFLAAQDVTVDFARKGNGAIANTLKQLIPFFGASVQGVNRTVRQFTEAERGMSTEEALHSDAARRFVKTVINTGILSAVLSALLHATLDDDEKKEFLQMSSGLKSTHFYLPNFAPAILGQNPLVRIPVGQDPLMYAVHGLVTDMIWSGRQDGPAIELAEIGQAIFDNLNPFGNGTIFEPLLAVARNKTYYGSAIIPSSMQYDAPSLQYSDSTPEVFVGLGRVLNTSPNVVQYLAEQYTGFLGQIAIPMMSKTDSGNLGGFEALRDAVQKKFTSDPLTNNDVLNDYYDGKNWLTTIKNAYDDGRPLNMLRRNLTDAEAEEAYTEAKNLLAAGGAVGKAYKDIKALYTEINTVQSDQSLSATERRTQVDKLRRQLIEVALEAQEAIADYRDRYYTGYNIVFDRFIPGWRNYK